MESRIIIQHLTEEEMEAPKHQFAHPPHPKDVTVHDRARARTLEE